MKTGVPLLCVGGGHGGHASLKVINVFTGGLYAVSITSKYRRPSLTINRLLLDTEG
jgi:peptidyl-tRNA hydrolase